MVELVVHPVRGVYLRRVLNLLILKNKLILPPLVAPRLQTEELDERELDGPDEVLALTRREPMEMPMMVPAALRITLEPAKIAPLRPVQGQERGRPLTG